MFRKKEKNVEKTKKNAVVNLNDNNVYSETLTEDIEMVIENKQALNEKNKKEEEIND